MSSILEEHRLYLSDATRIALFRRAIGAVVKPGDIVLDLACGTGVLGLLAIKAGAARVYQVDESPMIQLAHDVASANGYAQSTFAIHDRASRANLPEKADVVIADQLSAFGIGAGMPTIFNDARRRLLKAGARAIPQRIELFVAAVNFPEMWQIVSFWDKPRAGLKMRPARSIAFNSDYATEKRPRLALSRPAPIFAFDLAGTAPERFSAKAVIEVSAAGVMHGLSGWFSAELAPRVIMTNSPFSKTGIHRSSAFFPIEKPVALSRGDRLQIAISAITPQNLLGWNLSVFDTKGREKARFVHSTLKGMPLTPAELAKTRPDFVPRLSAWGMARKSVVNLADGTRTLAEIERELFRIHPALFPSLVEASAYVTRVLLPHSLP
jgi:hypothetical protein